MKCQVCQADIAPGSTFCTNCGTPIPANNPYGSPATPSSPNQGIAPTMLATPSNPTMPPNPYTNPYNPPPVPSNPYSAPPPANSYGTPSTDYGASPYGAPPTPPANPYGMPQAAPYGAPGTFPPPYIPPQPQKKGPNGCVIAAIIVVALVVLIGGGITFAAYKAYNTIKTTANNAISGLDATATADIGTANALTTPSTGNTTSGVPNASQISPAAKANLFNAQTASKVDENSGKPVTVTSSFTAGDTIYITFQLSGKGGYLTETTYDSGGNIVVKSSSPHSIDSGFDADYLYLTGVDAGSYTTGVYWCDKSDCSDAGLAQIVTFTVS